VTPEGAIEVEREVRIRARPETIFPFFTDPALMVQWMGRRAEVEPVPGGVYRVDIQDGRVARGEYLEVSPYERVIFTWGWEEGASTVGPGTTTVSVTLVPDGAETVVRLVHGDLPAEAAAQGHAKGWEHYLPRLQIAAEGGDAGPDPGIGNG
jgi:uncharacterized protein YndB with AHSA1/START domain